MGTDGPKLELRDERPYVGIRRQLSRPELGEVLGPLLGELFGWLRERGIEATGAPFFRYRVVDSDAHLEVEAAIPVASRIFGDERVVCDSLPGGRYLVSVHQGPFEGLRDATAFPKSWADENGVVLKTSRDGTAWGSRLETYLTDPDREPDPENWMTEIAILTEGGA